MGLLKAPVGDEPAFVSPPLKCVPFLPVILCSVRSRAQRHVAHIKNPVTRCYLEMFLLSVLAVRECRNAPWHRVL